MLCSYGFSSCGLAQAVKAAPRKTPSPFNHASRTALTAAAPLSRSCALVAKRICISVFELVQLQGVPLGQVFPYTSSSPAVLPDDQVHDQDAVEITGTTCTAARSL